MQLMTSMPAANNCLSQMNYLCMFAQGPLDQSDMHPQILLNKMVGGFE